MRRNRVEAQADTRAQLLDAAATLFLAQGFGATSIEAIAALAGFTRGAFYSNFPDKDAIFLALMDARLAARVADVRALLDAAEPGRLVEALRPGQGDPAPDPAWVVLTAEFRAHALRHPPSARQLAAREAALLDLFAQAVDAQFRGAGIAPPAPPRQLALVVAALDRWLPVQQALDVEGVGPDELFNLLELLFRAAVALAGTAG